MRCNERIVLGKYHETYCQLETGHEGTHSAENAQRIRCQACDGIDQCTQPAGHFGSHTAGGIVKRLWQ